MTLATRSYVSIRRTIPLSPSGNETNGAFLVMAGLTVTLRVAMRVLHQNQATGNSAQNSDQSTCFEYTLFQCFQCDGLRTFSQLVGKYFESKGVILDSVGHRETQAPISVYIFAYKVPSLENAITSNCVVVEESNRIFPKRIVAADGYYNAPLEDLPQ